MRVRILCSSSNNPQPGWLQSQGPRQPPEHCTTHQLALQSSAALFISHSCWRRSRLGLVTGTGCCPRPLEFLLEFLLELLLEFCPHYTAAVYKGTAIYAAHGVAELPTSLNPSEVRAVLCAAREAQLGWTGTLENGLQTAAAATSAACRQAPTAQQRAGGSKSGATATTESAWHAHACPRRLKTPAAVINIQATDVSYHKCHACSQMPLLSSAAVALPLAAGELQQCFWHAGPVILPQWGSGYCQEVGAAALDSCAV